MFTRTEILNAVGATNALQIPEFKRFLKSIVCINTHAIHSNEAKDAIREILYDKDNFDVVVSTIITIYNELVQTRTPTPVSDVFADIYRSMLLEDIRHICYPKASHHYVLNDHTDIENTDKMLEIIILLNIYYKEEEL